MSSPIDLLLFFSVLAGLLQLAGYIYYIQKTHRDDISPNPTTWLIFAFDTSVLTALEALAGAKWTLLFLPAMCSVGGIYIAWLLRKAGKLHWPRDKADAYILSIGIAIALSYTVIFLLWNFTLVSESLLFYAGYIFLILSNTNTLVAFTPIIKEVYTDPLHEHSGPWAIWTLAYATLTIVTYMEVGISGHGMIFYVYPISCLVLHGTVAWLARDARRNIFRLVTK